MKKYIPSLIIGLVLGAIAFKAYATTGVQYNWGTSLGSSWSTPDDTAVMKNQVLQIGANGTASVVASTNVVIPGTLSVTGTSAFTTTATFSGGYFMGAFTITQLQALTPTASGQFEFCSNCTITPLVFSTGTAVAAWAGVYASTGNTLVPMK